MSCLQECFGDGVRHGYKSAVGVVCGQSIGEVGRGGGGTGRLLRLRLEMCEIIHGQKVFWIKFRPTVCWYNSPLGRAGTNSRLVSVCGLILC